MGEFRRAGPRLGRLPWSQLSMEGLPGSWLEAGRRQDFCRITWHEEE